MKPHVLVVDDSLTVRMDLRGALNAAGFDVTVCDTRRAAVELLDNRNFSALVLDIMLPDGDGVEILQRVRANPHSSSLPVIVLSSEADVRDRVRGLTMGADEYVGKPYNIAYFIGRLRELCRRTRNSAPPPPSIVGSRRILAVDDSPTFLAHLARSLREDGHDVVLARSGHEALDMLAAQTIDCVILDLQMPHVDGIETVRMIRQTPGRESTPTLMLTASENPEDQRNATAAGVDDFLRKTVALDIVRAKIRNLLRQKYADLPHVDAQNSNKSAINRTSVHDRTANVVTANQRSASSNASKRSKEDVKSPANHFSALFIAVAAAMGLEADPARESLARTLSRMGVDPRCMSEADLSRALPALEDTLAMFCPVEDAAARSRALAALAARARRSGS
ncbi:MAG: response regulator [Polyangiaceae bacterium]|nr:response regulator [Polyangiaceae bacterium]